MSTSVSGTTAGSTAASSATSSTQNALSSLSGNFGDFLNLLMTQLQNQDPTAPLDANSFTSELVQFAGVEQEINTNTSLTQLIQLTQGTEMEQASQVVGKQVAVNSSQLSLQSGQAGVQFNSSGPQQVEVAVYSSSGVPLVDQVVNASSGSNTWAWNGQTSSGYQLPDGTYTVQVTTPSSNGHAGTSIPFTVLGTVTGVQGANNAVNVELGGLSVNFDAVQQIY